MRRTRKQLLTLAAVLAAAATPSRAHAFHAGQVFDEPPGAGGGGGITFAGLPSERGWTCAACHLDVPGTVRVTVVSDPPDLLNTGVYVPGRSYLLQVALRGEHEGLNSPATNYNSVSINAVGPAGAPAGILCGYAPEALYAHSPASVVSAGVATGTTSWLLSWQAPADATPVAIRIAAVDGNGDGGPLGDDVYVSTLNLKAATSGVSVPRMMGPSRSRTGSAWLSAVIACGAWSLRRRARRETSAR